MAEDPYPFWHPKRHPDISGIILAAFTISQIVSLWSFQAEAPIHNVLGLFGYISGALWLFLFGPISLLGLFGLGALSSAILQNRTKYCSWKRLVAATVSLFSLSMLTTLLGALFPALSNQWYFLLGAKQTAWLFPLGGLPMNQLYYNVPYINFENLFNIVGTALLSCTSLFISLIKLFDLDLSLLWKAKEAAPRDKEKTDSVDTSVQFGINIDETPKRKKSKKEPPLWPAAAKAAISISTQSGPATYRLPDTSLLNPPKKVDLTEIKKELKRKADQLEATLSNFGVEAKVGQIHCGPTITMFEVHPPTGVKVGKIKNLDNDIALNMEAKSIRIIAPIPGKAAVGIEVPNHRPQEVNFKELLSAYQQRATPHKIPMLLGKAVNGDLVLADLTKMPHCIIAGATGSGKSVCINSIIMSILMLARPDEIRFLMIDPKKVELAPYTNLPHMLAPVITEPHTAAASLNWLVREMEKRYEILRITGKRNIDSFNKRTPNPEVESKAHVTIPDKFPYIVGIIDELADLMMIASQDVETPIARIAQMARAVGIHLILATQRPSREVITGIIKANFPARISFKVASRVNSQIVLDDVGAETLLGNGDMLILLPGSSQPLRAQGVFVRDDEINRVLKSINTQISQDYIIGSLDQLEAQAVEDGDDSNLDELFEEAKQTVFSTGNASTTFLQRKLKIGYARAASIMDQLERKGIIGPQDGARPRKIYFPKHMQEEVSSEVGDSLG